MQSPFVVVGIDDSPAADAALRWAADEAQRRGARLRIVHAFRVPPAGQAEYPPEVADQIRARSQQLLDRATDTVRDGWPALTVMSSHEESDAAEALVRASRHARMIVVGSRGRGRMRQAVAGSVAIAVVAHAHSPVAVIGDHPGHPAGPIVVAADGSDRSDAAVGFAVEEAAVRKAAVVAILGWDEIGGQPHRRTPSLVGRSAEAGGAELLDAQLAPWRQKFPDVHIQPLVHPGPVSDAIVGWSGGSSGVLPQLVVVGSRGRGAVTGLVLGSTSQQLLAASPSPVVVVRGEPAA